MKFLLPLFLCSSLFAQNITNLYVGQQLSVGMQLTTVPSAVPSLTCQTYIALGGSYSANINCSSASEQVYNDTGNTIQVCSFSAVCHPSDAVACHVEIWSSPDATGTQYGGSSSPSGGTAFALYTFTWSTPVSIPPGVYVWFVIKGLSEIQESAIWYPYGITTPMYYPGYYVPKNMVFGVNTMQ